MALMVFNLVAGGLIGLLLAMMVAASIRESQWRAALLSLAAFAGILIAWGILITFRSIPLVQTINLILLIFLPAVLLLAWIPWFPRSGRSAYDPTTIAAMDEREHMFSRNELQHHPHLAEIYYADHPGQLEADRTIHKAPELGEPGGIYFHPRFAPMATAAFQVLDDSRRSAPTDHLSADKRAQSVEPETGIIL